MCAITFFCREVHIAEFNFYVRLERNEKGLKRFGHKFLIVATKTPNIQSEYEH